MAGGIVKVEACYGSHATWRLTLPDGSREILRREEGDGWSRKYATEALDLLVNVYHYDRRQIKFNVC